MAIELVRAVIRGANLPTKMKLTGKNGLPILFVQSGGEKEAVLTFYEGRHAVVRDGSNESLYFPVQTVARITEFDSPQSGRRFSLSYIGDLEKITSLIIGARPEALKDISLSQHEGIGYPLEYPFTHLSIEASSMHLGSEQLPRGFELLLQR